MIIARLIGGLGNQLFQYAVARRLALRHGTCLRLDRAWYAAPGPDNTPREYALGAYCIRARPLGAFGRARALEYNSGRLARALRTLGLAPTHRLFKQTVKGYMPEVLELPNRVCLDGFWTSERYFADRADTIQSELSLRAPPRGRNREAAERIAAARLSVSLHFRRGDYVTNPIFNAMFGVCEPAYYRAALEQLRARHGPIDLAVVFSDDPQWVRDNLELPAESLIVDWNRGGGGREVEDLRLMSLCRHHVIANSSFSWWGAWLDPRPDKTVIAPKRWFRSPSRESSHIVPEQWLRL